MKCKNGLAFGCGLSIRAVLLIGICLLAVSPVRSANKSGGEDDSEGGKNLLMGVIDKIEEESLLIRKPSSKGEQKILLDKETGLGFVGFKGIGKLTDKPEVGIAIKAMLTKDNIAKHILFSPNLPTLNEIPNKHELTAEQLFKATDLNKNGEVDYLEYASKIFQSPKHLPDRYQTKFDVNQDDVLNLREFTDSLDRLEWWRLSRKSAEEWVRSADKDNSGELDKTEALPVTGSAHGKYDKLFEKLDEDKSGGISLTELKPFLHTGIHGKKEKKEKKEK